MFCPILENSKCFKGKLTISWASWRTQVSELRNSHPYCNAWLDAAKQYGLPRNLDFNAETTEVVNITSQLDQGGEVAQLVHFKASATSYKPDYHDKGVYGASII